MNQTVHRASTPCKDFSSAHSMVPENRLCDSKLNVQHLITLIYEEMNLLGPEMFVEGGLNTNYIVLSNLFGSFDFNRGTN